MHEAEYYEHLADDKVRCRVCPHNCLIHPDRAGICFVRLNRGGHLEALTYGRVSSIHLDPIEKKPLHFFYPGSSILSIGSIGCSLCCFFCQNWTIAQPRAATKDRPPDAVAKMTEPLPVEELVGLAKETVPAGNIGVAFTYNEPMIWIEYVMDAAQALREAGLKTVLVTNGYVNEAPLKDLLPYVNAMNIDIKSFDEKFYKRVGGGLPAIKRTAELANQSCHIELTNLLIPGLNTSTDQIEALVDWVADTLGPKTPLHFSRYFPAHKASIRATSIEEMDNAYRLASKRLSNVVLGNI